MILNEECLALFLIYFHLREEVGVSLEKQDAKENPYIFPNHCNIVFQLVFPKVTHI